jgi:hypothetical protein
VPGDELADEHGVVEGRRSEDGAGGSSAEDRGDRCCVAQPAGDLHQGWGTRAVGPGCHDVIQDPVEAALPGPGAIEVYQVEPSGAGCAEGSCHGRRIVAVRSLPIERALLEPDDPTPADIDGWQDLEA